MSELMLVFGDLGNFGVFDKCYMIKFCKDRCLISV